MKFAFVVQNLAQVSDSVGYDCIYQYKTIRELYPTDGGVRIFSEVFDRRIHCDIDIEPMKDFWEAVAAYPDACIIYHFCDGWTEIDEFLRETARNAVIRWHNNTPPWFYIRDNVDFAADCNRGYDIISRFAHAGSVRFMVNSEFTRRQLHALGGLDSLINTVFPASTFLLKDRRDNRAALPQSADRPIELLFVGRVVQHKGHRHILSVAAVVQRFCERPVRVLFAGALEARLQNYWLELTDIGVRLGVETVFLGLVSDADLAELYASCDAFICMSEHEGFGMPVFEAMRSHVPVIAWSTSAMADLLKGHPFASSEFSLHRFAACVIAAMEPSIRQRVIALQQYVLEGYTDATVRSQLCAAIARAEDLGLDPISDAPAVPDIDDIATFVSNLTEWIEQEIGTSVEVFIHDAPVNYVSLYDIAIHDRLIRAVYFDRQARGARARSDHFDELHPFHSIIRHAMLGEAIADVNPPRDLETLLSFDDEVFVRLAYWALLGREVDSGGLSIYLRRIRKGEDKLRLLRELASSAEGRKHGGRLGKAVLAAGQPSDIVRLQQMETTIGRLQRFLAPEVGGPPPHDPLGSIRHVDDLLQLNTPSFIDMSYRILLGHAVEAGRMDRDLAALRQGQSRHAFLSALRRSLTEQDQIGSLEGLSAYLAAPEDGADPVSIRVARLSNELGRLTNQLALWDQAPSGVHAQEPDRALLRLTEQAVRTSSSPSMESLRALSLERAAGRREAVTQSAGLCPAETQAGPGEIEIHHIHQILINDEDRIPDELPDIVQRNRDSLRRFYPEAEYRLWGADDLRQFIAAHFEPAVVEGFDILQAYALKADLGRYCLLYVFGGLYSDLSNRFLSRWRIAEGKTIACFREHKPLHGAVWMLQNTLIYASPGQPELRLAIDLVLENIRNREYGVSSLAPTGPILFGRAMAAVGQASSYQIGDAINLPVEGGLNRANYVDRDGTLVAARLQGNGGCLSELGLQKTNVYGEMWSRREIYGEGLLLFAHDNPAVETAEPRDIAGIVLGTQGKERGISIRKIALPRGQYRITARFLVKDRPGAIGLAVDSDGGTRQIVRGKAVLPDDCGDVGVAFTLDEAMTVDVHIRVGHAFHGLFKRLMVRGVSQHDSDVTLTETEASGVHAPEARSVTVQPVSHIHHIAYHPAVLALADESEIAENIRLAAALHDGARQMVWTEASLREFIASRFNADVVWAYDCLPQFMNRSELGRYCLLYALGGLYVDPWLRMVSPIGVAYGKQLTCFRSAEVEDGASWSIDTSLLHAEPGRAEFEQLIDQIVEGVRGGDYGAIPTAVTGAERLGRGLAISYDARRYFGGEIVPMTRGRPIVNDCFVSQDGRLIAVCKGSDNPITRMRQEVRAAWLEGRIYAHVEGPHLPRRAPLVQTLG
ncbi:glycosyltransferase [Sphingobium lignivorans]|uniref:Glycosyltransferase involved in cell wall biosynthesis n=1 Tax=Sphingobium lignivorans TaxID=2735886 RepID=A0ABR6NCQ1_9SPHN|nr:glycosyltransferase [Sphingobium lignivorans]MBB5985034.1 glycosyltransferase involved in cell wall biosynthesis [Sphingobium lignivorans]